MNNAPFTSEDFWAMYTQVQLEKVSAARLAFHSEPDFIQLMSRSSNWDPIAAQRAIEDGLILFTTAVPPGQVMAIPRIPTTWPFVQIRFETTINPKETLD